MQTFDDMPGWQFEIDEVSMGVYEVIVRDAAALRVGIPH
jgi:hypothetical protein